ncbi:MAG: NAD-dependent epimerase/dehydratase family protein [Planctomycetota bacterium]|nr:NAD-dependent epimerase/dehydratase family protein [Planctomycetota bacterium]
MSDGTSRRELIGATIAGAGLALAGGALLGTRAARAEEEGGAAKKLKLLILGGTGFLGPHTVRAALERGHEMTLFNRGRTNTHLFPDLEKLQGDRDGKLDALKGRKWDAVIDTSGYVPRIVKMSAELLKDSVQQYVFISTISVYPGFGRDDYPIDEDSEIGTMEDPTNESVRQFYGPLKALCEAEAEKVFPGRTTNIRPGLIVGPGDPTDRFSYWPYRVMRGGTILAPGDGTTEVQVIDARDLAAWTIHTIEQQVTGVYNATGFKGRVRFEEFLHGCKCAINHDCSFDWASEAFLKEHKVRPFMELPLWIPKEALPYVRVDKAIKAGLTFRPIAITSADTAEWIRTERDKAWRLQRRIEDETKTKPWRVGIRPEREKTLLRQRLDYDLKFK